MLKYSVFIHGRNILREIDGIRQRYGFYTTVFVEALTPSDAKSRAIEVLRDDAHLYEVALNAEDDPWTLSTDDVHEIASFDGVRPPRRGLAFYEENSDDTKDVA